ncbi:hypothetical protein P0936_14770, partial [Acinetobacter nosocomialis]|nr:hypothetical protein [Acinetobacter nosocomialis]
PPPLFFFKQKTGYDICRSLVGSEMCIRDSVKSDVIKKHNDLVQKHLQTTVFNSGGCKSYYLDANGRNFAAWPWSLKKLKQRLKKLDLKDYDVIYQTSKTH